nr:Ser-Thr-rich GPI-anchored membrane family protein [Melioribacteraceae bacterium]
DVATASGLIRVSHAVSPTDILDISQNFIISKLIVNSPNGGEYWQAGTNKNISWSSSIAGNVKLEYSLNNGVNWDVIASPVPANLGNYNWLIPSNLSSKQVLIKVTDLINPVIKDSSDAVFKIGTVNITNVFGGESWQTNSSKTINFTASNSVNTVNFEYTLDGIIWTPFALGVPANSGSVVWNIGNIPSSIQAKIRVSDSESSLGISYTTNNFNVIKLNINSPNGNEILQAGKQATISWESSEQVPFVNILYSTDSGQNWLQIANNVISVPNVVSTYTWLVPSNIISSNNLIKIVSASDPTIVTTSLNKFTIGNLTFTNPNVNSKWQTNNRYKIEWNSQLIGDVRLEYSLDNGISWNSVINSYNSDLHFYNWDIPIDSYSNQAQVKITSNINPLVSETTPPFTIKRLEVKIPNGGENWKAGTPRTITWDANFVNSVTIYLSSDNGQTWENIPIAKNISGNGGQHSWFIPVDYSGKNYKIKLVDDEVSYIRDSSSTPFTINSFALTSPAGNEVWQAGTTHKIKWTVNNVNSVFLEYSLDNGITWNNIISNLNAELKEYDWAIPDVSSNQARIKITDHQDNNNYYISNPFTINRLIITSPNGGELWQAGTIKPITWTSSLINNITLEYTLDNGSTWQNIASNINAALFTYNWNIPSGISSTDVRIRAYDSGNQIYSDMSDSK